MHETGRILLDLFIIFAAAKVAGELFERFKQPAVIGELVVGILLGPKALGWIGAGETQQTVATMGVIILLFMVGLETKASDLFKVGKTAMVVAILGVVVPFAVGIAYGMGFGYETAEALFIGAALVATSVGISARVLADVGLISTRAAKIILAAAVIDDILGLIVLAVVAGIGEGGLNLVHVGLVGLQALSFAAFQVFVAPRLVKGNVHLLDALKIRHAPFVVALAIMLGLSALAESIGLAAIVGAFFAGMAFAETCDRYPLEEQAEPLAEFLVPYFFVVMGTQVDLGLLLSPAVLLPGLLLTALAIAAKVLGCGVGALGEGRRGALAIGVGMVPRGEVGLIVASVGLAMGLVAEGVYAQVVMVSILTTLVVPPLLPALFRRASATGLEAVPVSAESCPAPVQEERHRVL